MGSRNPALHTVASFYKHAAYKHNPLQACRVPTKFVCEISTNSTVGYARETPCGYAYKKQWCKMSTLGHGPTTMEEKITRRQWADSEEGNLQLRS